MIFIGGWQAVYCLNDKFLFNLNAYVKARLNYSRNNTDSAELVTNYEQSLALADILPIHSRQYDKNRAPKLLGQPTVVYFHVTVLSIDSINEESMVIITTLILHVNVCSVNLHVVCVFLDVRDRHIFSSKLERSSTEAAGKYERGI